MGKGGENGRARMRQRGRHERKEAITPPPIFKRSIRVPIERAEERDMREQGKEG